MMLLNKLTLLLQQDRAKRLKTSVSAILVLQSAVIDPSVEPAERAFGRPNKVFNVVLWHLVFTWVIYGGVVLHGEEIMNYLLIHKELTPIVCNLLNRHLSIPGQVPVIPHCAPSLTRRAGSGVARAFGFIFRQLLFIGDHATYANLAMTSTTVNLIGSYVLRYVPSCHVSGLEMIIRDPVMGSFTVDYDLPDINYLHKLFTIANTRVLGSFFRLYESDMVPLGGYRLQWWGRPYVRIWFNNFVASKDGKSMRWNPWYVQE